MDKIKFAIVGSGWRSKFYIRSVKQNPELLELTSMLFRSRGKAKLFKQEFDITVTTLKEELINSKPDFIVVAVSKSDLFFVTKEYLGLGIPVLVETPGAVRVKDLTSLWSLRTGSGSKLQVAEQYFLYPYYKEILHNIKSGIIGETQFISISSIHDHHAASIFRQALGVTDEEFTIFGRSINSKVTTTDSRDGKIRDGSIGEFKRNIITIEFKNGKSVLYNFSGVQYFSDIISKNIVVQGVRGEINNNIITYLNKNNIVKTKYIPYELDDYINTDQKLVLDILMGMKRYIDTGVEFYPLKEALQDSYISILMHKAIDNKSPILSEKQVWQ